MKRTVTALVLFLMGAVIYLLFRPRSLVGFTALDLMGLGPWADQMRQAAMGWSIPEFVVYCLPNGLWSTSYILLIDVLLATQSRRVRILVASIIPLLGAVSEVLQAFALCPGTFDVLDLCCYLVPFIFYLYHFKGFKRFKGYR